MEKLRIESRKIKGANRFNCFIAFVQLIMVSIIGLLFCTTPIVLSPVKIYFYRNFQNNY